VVKTSKTTNMEMFSDENQLKSTTLTSSKVVPQLKIGFKKIR
jgi:hypothetical protein